MRLVVTPQYCYHVTERRWPPTVYLKPLSNDQVKDCNRASDEPTIARICVSPIISGCVVAIQLLTVMTLNVYRTANKVRPAYTYGVEDSRITKERWIIRPTWFIKHATITRDIMKEINKAVPFFCPGLKENMEDQRKARRIVEEILRKNSIIET